MLWRDPFIEDVQQWWLRSNKFPRAAKGERRCARNSPLIGGLRVLDKLDAFGNIRRVLKNDKVLGPRYTSHTHTHTPDTLILSCSSHHAHHLILTLSCSSPHPHPQHHTTINLNPLPEQRLLHKIQSAGTLHQAATLLVADMKATSFPVLKKAGQLIFCTQSCTQHHSHRLYGQMSQRLCKDCGSQNVGCHHHHQR